MLHIPRHKVFISYHHALDQRYKEQFAYMMQWDIVDKSVNDGDIDDDNLKVDTIRRKIRDDFIRDATVTVVLIGPCTWQRKHVDWEIGSSLSSTSTNSRCGLLGIILPNHSDANKSTYNPHRLPPRLADNVTGPDPFAKIYHWTSGAEQVRRWVHDAFLRRNGTPPNNGRLQFKNNRSGDCTAGWQN